MSGGKVGARKSQGRGKGALFEGDSGASRVRGATSAEEIEFR